MAWVKVDAPKRSSDRSVGTAILLSEEAATLTKTMVYDTDVGGGGTRMHITSIRVELTTAAVIATRRIRLTVQDAGADIIQQFEFIPTFSTVTASHTWEAASGAVERIGTDVDMVTLPDDFILHTGQTLLIEQPVAAAGDMMVVHVRGIRV